MCANAAGFFHGVPAYFVVSRDDEFFSIFLFFYRIFVIGSGKKLSRSKSNLSGIKNSNRNGTEISISFSKLYGINSSPELSCTLNTIGGFFLFFVFLLFFSFCFNLMDVQNVGRERKVST